MISLIKTPITVGERSWKKIGFLMGDFNG